MVEILEQHPLPVLVQFSTRYEIPREARGGSDGGPMNLLIEYRYEEIYLQGNFYAQGVIAKESASITLCPLISMAPIHGQNDKTKTEFDQYLQRMTDFVERQSQFSEKTCNLGMTHHLRMTPPMYILQCCYNEFHFKQILYSPFHNDRNIEAYLLVLIL
jgi:hypothetical protein